MFLLPSLDISKKNAFLLLISFAYYTGPCGTINVLKTLIRVIVVLS